MTPNIEIHVGDPIRDNDSRRSVDNKPRMGKVREVLADGRVVIDWDGGKKSTTVARANIGSDAGGRAGKYTLVGKAKAA